MWHTLFPGVNVLDARAPGDQRVGKQPAMALLGTGLGTHHGDALSTDQGQQGLHRLGERRGLHVIRVAPESGVSQRAIARVGHWRPAPSELPEMRVADTRGGQSRGERLPTEVRMPPRSGKASHVGDVADAVGLEEREELVELPGRVSDGEDQLW